MSHFPALQKRTVPTVFPAPGLQGDIFFFTSQVSPVMHGCIRAHRNRHIFFMQSMQVCDSQRKPAEREIGQNRAQRARLRAARLSSLCQTEEAGHRATAQTQNKGRCGQWWKKNHKNTTYLAWMLPTAYCLVASGCYCLSLLPGRSHKYKLTGAIGKPFKGFFPLRSPAVTH